MKAIKIIQLNLACLILLSTGLSPIFAEVTENSLTSTAKVKFKPSTQVTPPVDPEGEKPNTPIFPWDPTEPEGKPKPGTSGPLSIDFVSSFDFGANEISNDDQSYYARSQLIVDKEATKVEARPNYVQITDNRGTNEGWTLSVKQQGQLKSDTKTHNDELIGAYIKLSAPKVRSNSNASAPTPVEEIVLDPSSSENVVLSALLDEGAGTWTNAWGEPEIVTEENEEGTSQDVSITKDVALFVPGETPKDAVVYKSILTWILSDLPTNQEV
ncbi:WxL domain-containing protein [Vagococcus fessus]|uniref:WxL domain-containing protein n=1 Tax=Vagococcus fessus TaxID=120370 RepID=A0A430ACI5_9ENTE|nr:WxL domain-containing protein [Vagococcus fessus]RSU04923.1 hypothetical protein CBF31_02565 [Vagococcus fessus]